MRAIRLVVGDIIEAFDGPTEEITPDLLRHIFTPARRNKALVLDGAADIERMLEVIIGYHFLGHSSERATQFRSWILTSDWCSFSSKRRLVVQILKATKAVEPTVADHYDGLLGGVMQYRNAFTHGTLSTDGRRVKLAYFEGEPRSVFLDDEYLMKVEAVLGEAWRLTLDVAIATGASRLAEGRTDAPG